MRSWAVIAVLLFLSAPLGQAETNSGLELRISAANLVADANTVFVAPGETITLTADMWMIGQSCRVPTGCAQHINSDHFLWSSDDRPSKICDPYHIPECQAETEFKVMHSGVQYQVPNPMPERLTLTAKDRDRDFAGTLFLARKTIVVTRPSMAPPAARMVILQKTGHWVTIDGLSYWTPNAYHAHWVPYQQGYWTWVAGQGWTWISYDPWGYYTDHYGFWRLHATHGWVWQPFATAVYHPAVVTFFYTNGYVGWSPFYSGYPRGYRSGFAAGFRDGYGTGMGLNTPPPGSTMVTTKNFYAKNIVSVKANMKLMSSTYRAARKQNGIGPQPGQVDPSGSKQWIEARAGGPAPQTQMQTTRENGAELSQPIPIRPVPSFNQPIRATASTQEPKKTPKKQAKNKRKKKKNRDLKRKKEKESEE